MNRLVTIAVVLITLALLGGGVYFITKPSSAQSQPGKYDEFAKCLASKNITMYGAYWCPHCQNTKKEFGDAFQYVPYVECTVKVKDCNDHQINGYPTWIFPDGSRLEGEVSLGELSTKSGCSL